MTHPIPAQRCPERGFTLVETLVAISILIIAVVGPLYAVHKSITAAYAARDQLIATALAQEGIEYVRSVRDDNYLAEFPDRPDEWLAGLEECFESTGCTVDPNQASLAAAVASCPSGGCSALRQDADADPGVPKLYIQTTNSAYTPTRFVRKVEITEITATQVEVAVTVSWRTQQTPYSVTVTENLYNWL